MFFLFNNLDSFVAIVWIQVYILEAPLKLSRLFHGPYKILSNVICIREKSHATEYANRLSLRVAD